MKYLILLVSLVCFFISCEDNIAPELNNQINIISGNAKDAKSYDIPEGIFRGVLWPTPNELEFTVWIIRKNKEIYLKIPAPPEIARWEKQVTDQWQISEIQDLGTVKRYQAKKIDDVRPVVFDLPKKMIDYSFYVLADGNGRETILFMNISDKVTDSGLFGFIILNS